MKHDLGLDSNDVSQADQRGFLAGLVKAAKRLFNGMKTLSAKYEGHFRDRFLESGGCTADAAAMSEKPAGGCAALDEIEEIIKVANTFRLSFVYLCLCRCLCLSFLRLSRRHIFLCLLLCGFVVYNVSCHPCR